MPDEVLEQLEKGADARKRRNLDLVYEICREQHERGSKDFTLSTIGRLSQQRGGPVAQSFRNKGGGHLRAIISAWANHAGGMLKRPQKTSGVSSQGNALVDSLPHPHAAPRPNGFLSIGFYSF